MIIEHEVDLHRENDLTTLEYFVLLCLLRELAGQYLLHSYPDLLNIIHCFPLLILTVNGLPQSHFEKVVKSSFKGREVLLNLIVEKLEVLSLQADLSHG